MKKKIKLLFVIDALRKGGIRISLLNLLANLDYDKYEVHLFCFHFIKKDEEIIPKEVKIIYPNDLFDLVASTGSELKSSSYFKYMFRLFGSALCYIFNSKIIYNLIFKFEKRKFIYDVAISFTNNVGDHSLYFGSNKFVLDKVNAEKKITWLHADYQAMKLDTKINNAEYMLFDKIICVSQSVATSFLKSNILLKNKIQVVYNLLDTEKLCQLSVDQLSEEFDYNKLNCISIMRLDENKDPLFAVEIAKKLKDIDFNFYWRILGDGPLFEKTKSKIAEYELKNHIKLYGFIENPYPYLKKSDVYISTSNSEGYSMSILEALFFELDIICGKYDSVSEILNDRNGCVVEKNIQDYINVILTSKYKRKEHYILHSNVEILKTIDKLLSIQ